MQQEKTFVTRSIYHHRSNDMRQITMMVFKHRDDRAFGLIMSDCCCEEPQYWEGSRAEILEQWRHLNRGLRAEWFLRHHLSSSDADFSDLI